MRSTDSVSASLSRAEAEQENQPVDNGLIRCIYGSTQDDGFTIQCDGCLIWQHAFWVNINQYNIPELYLSDQCEKKPNLNKAQTPCTIQHELKHNPMGNMESKSHKSSTGAVQRRMGWQDKGKGPAQQVPGINPHFRAVAHQCQSQHDHLDLGDRKHTSGQTTLKKLKPYEKNAASNKTTKHLDYDKRVPLQSHGYTSKQLRDTHANFQRPTHDVIWSGLVKQACIEAQEKWNKLQKWQVADQRQGDIKNEPCYVTMEVLLWFQLFPYDPHTHCQVRMADHKEAFLKT